MIDKLVIGPMHDGPDRPLEELPSASLVHLAHPHRIREWVERIHTSKEGRWTVCTFSPTVIRAVIYFWDKDPLTFSRIILRSDSGKDTPLLDVFNPTWLAHFGIEDLYMNGEFDRFLR